MVGAIWDFRTIAMDWASRGVFDIILPMLLIFLVVYAVLQRTRILGHRKEVNAIVALIIGFFVMGNYQVSSFFQVLFSNAALGIAIFVVFLLLLGLVMPRPKHDTWNSITMIGGIGVFLWLMSRVMDYFGDYMIFSHAWWVNNMGWIAPLILILIVFSIALKDDRHQNQTISYVSYGDWDGPGPIAVPVVKSRDSN